MKKTNKQSPITNNQTKEEFDAMKNQLARAMADYANLRKKVEEERVEMFKLASISFMNKILPIIDNLKLAQNHVQDSGVAMIIVQMESLAKEQGFEEIKIQLGDIFSEETMEVSEVIETSEEKDNNTISEVLVSGWKYNDGTVVRHARVKVLQYQKSS
jgi:molecular chaperone GrpE